MLKLYGGARSRAFIVQWYLEELGIPYEFVQLDMQAGEHLQPAYLAVNPVGKVPAIVDGDFVLWESGAILLYLAEKYGGSLQSAEQRAMTNQWILYANATLGPGVFMEASREREFPRQMKVLSLLLEKQSFILGEEFSVADVAVGSILGYMPLLLKLEFHDYPVIMNYLKRIQERPAYQRAIAARK